MSSRFYCLLTVVVVLLGLLVSSGEGGFIRQVRNVDSESAVEQKQCDGPCGWAVYKRFTREVDYFMKNPHCNCSNGTECRRAGDDLSVGAYVYMCQAKVKKNQNDPSS